MEIFHIFTTSEAWIALLSLTILEIVLGIDNILFISILSAKLPKEKQPKAQKIGLFYAMILRIAFLFAIVWIIQSTEPILEFYGMKLSIKDLILLFGGLFLLYKSTVEIHDKITGEEKEKLEKKAVKATYGSVVFQIVMLNVVFSFDSILTAIGMTEHIIIMIIAVVISMIIMIAFINTVGNFILKHPTLQILGLSFLVLIGTLLIAEAFHYEIPKGYIYFAFFYSFVIELLNMRVRKNKKLWKKKLN